MSKQDEVIQMIMQKVKVADRDGLVTFKNINANGENLDYIVLRAADSEGRHNGGVFVYDLNVHAVNNKNQIFSDYSLLDQSYKTLGLPDVAGQRRVLRTDTNGRLMAFYVGKTENGWEVKTTDFLAPQTKLGQPTSPNQITELAKKLEQHGWKHVLPESDLSKATLELIGRHNPTGYLKFEGVAGSGKTEVLARRAFKALEAGRRVLFVTFNITLRTAILERVNGLAAASDDPDKMFYLIKSRLMVTTYSRLMEETVKSILDPELDDRNTILNELVEAARNKKVKSVFDNDRNPQSNWKNLADVFEVTSSERLKKGIAELPKYDDVLLDEGQDIIKAWQQNLSHYFWRGPDSGGSFVIAGDLEQNLYGRESDDNEVTTLKENHRSNNGLPKQIRNIREHFKSVDVTKDENLKAFFDNFADVYKDVFVIKNVIKDSADLTVAMKQYATEYVSEENDQSIVFVSDSLKKFTDDNLQVASDNRRRTRMTTVERANEKRENELDSWAKYHFYPGPVMVSTVKSFKGHQANTVVYLYDIKRTLRSEESFAQLWVALTRAKNRIILQPVDYGNETWQMLD